MDRTGIQMQMLSSIPKTPTALMASNDYAASLVRAHPSRFGMLAALPTDDPASALAEIERTSVDANGFAVTCCYKGVRGVRAGRFAESCNAAAGADAEELGCRRPGRIEA